MTKRFPKCSLDFKNLGWSCYENCVVKGNGWYKGIKYTCNELKIIISECSDEGSLLDLIKDMNGFYAGVVVIGNAIYLFVDHLASIPLFYDTYNQIIYDAMSSAWQKKGKFDGIAISEVIKSTMFACNQRTFCKDIQILLPGTLMKINEDGSTEEIVYYYHSQSCSVFKPSKDDFLKDIESLNLRVFSRVVENLNGRTAIVPLSGGYDSRFIVAMLKELNYENVICYTYGFSESTYETGISKKVAEILGYRHYCVILDESKWDSFFEDETVKEFLEYGFYYANLPHIQEILALRELRKLPDFPEDGVVLPGFCGDLFGGSYTLTIPQPVNTEYSQESAVEYIFNNNFRASSKLTRYDNEIKDDIRQFLNKLPYQIDDFESFNSAQMEWFISHKVAHFILPCNKTFEFFGYTWDMPLWDKELNEYKQNDSLYDYSLKKLLFEKYHIDFAKEKKHIGRYIATNLTANMKYKAKKIIYGMIMYIYYKFGLMLYFQKESNNFDYLCRLCYQRLESKKYIKFSEILRFETLVLWWIEQKIPRDEIIKIYENL